MAYYHLHFALRARTPPRSLSVLIMLLWGLQILLQEIKNSDKDDDDQHRANSPIKTEKLTFYVTTQNNNNHRR